MALRKHERRNYCRKLLVSIKYQNLHTFKEGLILFCQSILETRRTTHLHGSAHFTIPLIIRNKITLKTTVYRKQTHNRVYLHWKSIVPLTWKHYFQ